MPTKTALVSSPSGECATPSDAQWCQVAVPGLAPFFMALYAKDDIVSNNICSQGVWEDLDPVSLGSAGHAVDIGGNIGYFTFVLAQAGWNVTTFEPIPKNVALMQATLCQNPHLKSKIDIHNVGLGAKAENCQILSGDDNVGDGIARCGADAETPVPAGYNIRSSFSVHRLDDMRLKHDTVDFVKIDVEGFECQVFNGGRQFLEKYRPHHLHTEVWGKMQGCEPADYLNMFAKKGYHIASDEACHKKGATVPVAGEIRDYWMCDKAPVSLLQLPPGSIPPFQKRRLLLQLD